MSPFEPVKLMLYLTNGNKRVLFFLFTTSLAVSVRLVGGTMKSGRVEILHNNTWGTICDDAFTVQSAGVLCHMLGFSRSVFNI